MDPEIKTRRLPSMTNARWSYVTLAQSDTVVKTPSTKRTTVKYPFPLIVSISSLKQIKQKILGYVIFFLKILFQVPIKTTFWFLKTILLKQMINELRNKKKLAYSEALGFTFVFVYMWKSWLIRFVERTIEGQGIKMSSWLSYKLTYAEERIPPFHTLSLSF